MDNQLLFLLIGFGAVVFVLLYFIKQQKKERRRLEEKFEKNTDRMFSQLNNISSEVNRRLEKNVEVMQNQTKDVGKRIDRTQKVVSSVTDKLSKLEEASKRIYDVGKDISGLQELLQAPKMRGGVGEFLLSDVLSQVLPSENFSLQYEFATGDQVDAVIKLKDMIVPVDSKFPLENFKKIKKAEDEKKRKKKKKKFVRDVKKHVEKIARKYILPDEGTSDFALMYIPAENVYYEIILKEKEDSGLYEFCMEKKVVPVSPNSFYAYLQAIALGLRGMQIEKSTKEILTHISRLQTDFDKFSENFRVLGKHLKHARSSYEDSSQKLDRFDDKLDQIEKPNPQDALEGGKDKKS